MSGLLVGLGPYGSMTRSEAARDIGPAAVIGRPGYRVGRLKAIIAGANARLIFYRTLDIGAA